MRIVKATLDDALLALYTALLGHAPNVLATRGSNTEQRGVLIEIERPRARLSRSETRGMLFSALGEFLWYLTGDNRLDFIEPYIPRYRKESEDGGVTVYGGYGRRIFQQRGQDQLRNVLALLLKQPSSRKAVIQLFNAEDIADKHKEVPCTTTLQFLRRDEKIEMIVTMRSNDAYLGFPHDVFCFTMLQEVIARTLDCEVGLYRHFAGSMHLYDRDRADAQKLVDERFQNQIEMPPMPVGTPWPAIETVLGAEARIRAGEIFDAADLGLDSYWADLVRILQIYPLTDSRRIELIRDSLAFSKFRPYIARRIARAAKKTTRKKK